MPQTKKLFLAFVALVLSLQTYWASAQQASAVPALVNFNGTLTDASGKALTGNMGVSFFLYADQQTGAPLWMETQNVQADKSGHYTVTLGATTSGGLPPSLFAAGGARWLGVQAQGQEEQPRVLLVAVPYALKAADADTIGGKPASAFMLANPAGSSSTGNSQSAGTQSASSVALPGITGSGSPGFIAGWNSPSNLTNSALFQNLAGNMGISTTAPTQKFEVDMGNMLVRGPQNFQAAGNTAFVYVGDINHPIEAISHSGLTLGAYKVPQALVIADLTGNVGIGTPSPTAGALTTVSNNGTVLGLSVTGYSAPPNSFANGYQGATITGGSGDQVNQKNGGIGLVVNGGSAGSGGASGTAIIANGGGGDIFTGTGAGIEATGGGGIAGSSGGTFTAGDGRYDSGDGLDATGGEVSPTDAGFFNGGDYAGDFRGDVNVTGTLFAGTKDFRIDHPLDPAGKYLIHTSVESSEMKNIYDGMVTLDGNGEASVQLPAWFEAVNGDFRYQLTAIGKPGPGLYVSQEITGGRFQIAGGSPGGKVSWQVTGIRQDAYAKANPLVVEQAKNSIEKGHYIHPELFGAPEEQAIEWARHPVWMKHVQEVNRKNAAHRAAMGWNSSSPAAKP